MRTTLPSACQQITAASPPGFDDSSCPIDLLDNTLCPITGYMHLRRLLELNRSGTTTSKQFCKGLENPYTCVRVWAT